MIKKVLTITLILFFSLITIKCNATENTATYEFSFSDLSINKTSYEQGTFSVISLDDLQLNNLPGLPALPCKTASLVLPVGKTIKNIYVSYHFNSKIILSNPVQPMQAFQPFSEEKTDTFCYDVSDYGVNHLEFNQLVTTEIQYSHGYPILILNMRPVNYNPKTNELFYYDKISFTISFKETSVSSLYRNLDKDNNYIKTIIDNPEDFQFLDYQNTYAGGICDPSQKYDYVIITSSSLNSSWQSLIDHRHNFSNLDCIKISVQDIDACPDYWNVTSLFNDTQAHIREFCNDAYLDWETDYVILGGDWNSNPSQQIVPYRLFTDVLETQYYNTMPCDMYYSHLDGDWYYTPSSVWGGGTGDSTNDKYAELYLGRITAYNETMVTNAIDKIIWYDNHPFEIGWSDKMSFWGGNLGWTVTSKQYMEELRLGTDTYRTFEGFEEWNSANPYYQLNTSERLYHADLGSNYKDYFSNAVQNNNFSVVNHLDHSDWNSPFSLPNWQYRINTKPFFGYSQGCLAGRYTSGYAGCEQMMCRYPDRNAYALVLNTGYGYGSTLDTDGPGQYLQCYFWDYFFNATANDFNSWQLGKAQQYSKDKTSATIAWDHAFCYNWYSTHYFGDPAQIWYNPVILQPENNSSHESVYNEHLKRTATTNGTMDFYWSNDILIGNVTNLTKGQIASLSLPDYIEPDWLNHDTTYSWYIEEDGNKSGIYNFHTSQPWDCIEDGIIDYLDISSMSGAYGTIVTPGSIGPDINEDGQIDYTDVSSLSGHYGTSY